MRRPKKTGKCIVCGSITGLKLWVNGAPHGDWLCTERCFVKAYSVFAPAHALAHTRELFKQKWGLDWWEPDPSETLAFKISKEYIRLKEHQACTDMEPDRITEVPKPDRTN